MSPLGCAFMRARGRGWLWQALCNLLRNYAVLPSICQLGQLNRVGVHGIRVPALPAHQGGTFTALDLLTFDCRWQRSYTNANKERLCNDIKLPLAYKNALSRAGPTIRHSEARTAHARETPMVFLLKLYPSISLARQRGCMTCTDNSLVDPLRGVPKGSGLGEQLRQISG